MEIGESDLRKIELIRIYERVGFLLDMIRTIDKNLLEGVLGGISPEDKGTFMSRIMEHTLEYKNKIDDELDKEENNEKITYNN